MKIILSVGGLALSIFLLYALQYVSYSHGIFLF